MTAKEGLQVRRTADTVPGAVVITGMGVLCGSGIGIDALADALAGAPVPSNVSQMFPEPLPRVAAHALVGFAVRDHLGRKGTSFFDRSTSLGLVACRGALEDSELKVTDENRARFGITLGTTAGSASSTSNYSRDTFVQERPYLVNPLLFPNAVMNCAAGQAAIWFKLHGVNATIAGGPLAMLNVLRYARNVIRCGYADALLAGSVEEFSPHAAWSVHYNQRLEGGVLPPGEGAAVFVVESAEAVRAAGRRPDAEILATEVGVFDPPGTPGFEAGLRRCAIEAIKRAGVTPAEISAVEGSCGGQRVLDNAERTAVRGVIGAEADWFDVKQVVGEAHSAIGALQLAAIIARHRFAPELDGRLSLITTRSDDGAAGVAVVRGWSRGHRDHG